MRDNAVATKARSGPFEFASRGWRRLCYFFEYWNRSCIALLLTLAIFVPSSRLSPSVPMTKCSRRAHGTAPACIVSLAFAADGQSIATTDESGRATLWHAVEGWAPSGAVEFPGRATVVDFSSDGHYLAIGGDKPYVVMCDLARADWEHSPQIPARSISNLKLSPDGLTLAVSSHDSPEIVLWDLAAGRERVTLKGHSAAVMHMAFAPDGRSLASAAGTIADSRILIWNLATGQPERRITRLTSAPQAIAYSPDSRLVASACPYEKAVRIWDAQTGNQAQVIAGHSMSARSVAFSPDGRLLATATVDGTAGLWSVTTGREIRRLESDADVLRNVAFSPDGKTLAATANDGDIRLWDMDDLELRSVGAYD
jgi:tricorn protease-like protein